MQSNVCILYTTVYYAYVCMCVLYLLDRHQMNMFYVVICRVLTTV